MTDTELIDWMCEHYGFTREAMAEVYRQHHNSVDPYPDTCPVCRATIAKAEGTKP